ncbi:MAG: hypothetical protein P4L40_24560, partial [Terracidiphilus sp.]|nr:hypothetical protein [Terracidiphilus sp.]
GCDGGTGDANSSLYCPGVTDTTLQIGDHWFYTPGDGIRNLTTLIEVILYCVFAQVPPFSIRDHCSKLSVYFSVGCGVGDDSRFCECI